MKHVVHRIQLKNGAEGLLIDVPDASVMTFYIDFRAGEYLVDPDKWEVPHLMEHVLLGANELIPKARDFQAEIEKNGAYSNATTGVYDIVYEAECADFEWNRVFSLLLTSISKPLFLQEEFRAEFGNVQEEMTAYSNDHFRRLGLEMRKQLGLIAESDIKRLELMNNVTVDDVRGHYLRTHRTPNMRFVVTGRLSPSRRRTAVKMLENIELPQDGERFALPDERIRRLKKPVYIHNDTVENLYFYIDTFIDRRLKDPESDALHLVNTLLTETLYSKILGAARERGLVYGMSSGLSHTSTATNWWFGTQVSDKNIAPLFDIITGELGKLQSGKLSQKDIKVTKQYSLGRFQRSGQTVAGTAGGYLGRYFFDDMVDDYYRIPERIKAVSKRQIVDVVNDMFSDDLWGFGVLGAASGRFVGDRQRQLAPLWQSSDRRKS
jgi:predicted Zn-dependent peptidase